MKIRIMQYGIPLLGIWLIVGIAGGQDFFSLERPYSPVILKGENLPDLLGAQVEQIKACRYQSATGAWEPVPFQIDERDQIGLSFIGSKNGLLDAVDEIVFLAKDVGDRAPISDWVDDPESRNNARHEIQMADPLNPGQTGWLYLYQSAALPRSTIHYIQYNGESGVVETASFRIAHGANGFQDQIVLKPDAGGDGIDFLDRQKFRLKLIIRELGINKEVTLKEEMDENITLMPGFPAHVKVEKKGVRANNDPVIRLHRELALKGTFHFKFLTMEFNIDTSFSFPMLYYPNYMELSTGEIEFTRKDEFDVTECRLSTDLNQDAKGMIFYNPNNAAGDTIDGLKDTPNTSLAWPGTNWYMAVSNPQYAESKMKTGSMLTVINLTGDPIGNQTLYYLDWFWPDNTDTGDKSSYGDAGLRVTGSDLYGKLDASMASFYLPVNLALADAETIVSEYTTPLTIQPEAQRVHALVVSANPPGAGIVTWHPPGDLIAVGAEVSLNALAHPGFVFSNWTGDLSGNGNPAALVMDQDRTVVAHFTSLAYITINTDPSGVPFMVDGRRYFSQRTFTWQPGDTHVISADSITGTKTGVRALFNNWSNGSDRHFDYLVPGSDETITGSFTTQYLLTTRISPVSTGEIRLTPEGGWFDAGTTVSLLAVPVFGYEFTGWTGALTGQVNPATLIMSKPALATAPFGNQPPVVALADTGFAEDDTLTLTRQAVWAWVSDATHPDSVLDIALKEGEYIGVLSDSAVGEYRLYSKIGEWNGIDTLIIEARDPLGETGSGKLIVTVEARPDPPEPFALIAPENGETFTDWPEIISFSWEDALDPDDDQPTYIFEIDSSETFDSGLLIRFVELTETELNLPWPTTHGNNEYYWRVWAVDRDTLITRCAETYRTLALATAVAEEAEPLPESFTLDQNYPNPFNGETLIRFGLPKGGHVALSVFNSFGQRVATLIDAEKPAGYHTARWQGRDDTGQAVASGLYFIRIATPGFTAVKKTVYLR